MVQPMTNYDIHLMRLRGYSDGSGARPIDPKYERDSNYVWAYSYGQQAKRLFAEFSASSLGARIETIHLQGNSEMVGAGGSTAKIVHEKTEMHWFLCLQCSHEWRPSNSEFPKNCPRCQSDQWNKQTQTTHLQWEQKGNQCWVPNCNKPPIWQEALRGEVLPNGRKFCSEHGYIYGSPKTLLPYESTL
jgi:predicted Zn-ribbon and HTH transcriptional regulator